MKNTETIEETNAQPTTKIVYRDIKNSGYMEYTMHIIIRNSEGESKWSLKFTKTGQIRGFGDGVWLMNDENFLAQKEARESVSDPCDNCKLKECALSKIENMVYEAENRKYLV